MKTLVYWLILSPLIQWDYWLRRLGLRAGRLHWADRKAICWGYFGPWGSRFA